MRSYKFNKSHLKIANKITTDGYVIVRNLQNSIRAFSRKMIIKKIYV